MTSPRSLVAMLAPALCFGAAGHAQSYDASTLSQIGNAVGAAHALTPPVASSAPTPTPQRSSGQMASGPSLGFSDQADASSGANMADQQARIWDQRAAEADQALHIQDQVRQVRANMADQQARIWDQRAAQADQALHIQDQMRQVRANMADQQARIWDQRAAQADQALHIQDQMRQVRANMADQQARIWDQRAAQADQALHIQDQMRHAQSSIQGRQDNMWRLADIRTDQWLMQQRYADWLSKTTYGFGMQAAGIVTAAASNTWVKIPPTYRELNQIADISAGVKISDQAIALADVARKLQSTIPLMDRFERFGMATARIISGPSNTYNYRYNFHMTPYKFTVTTIPH